MPLRKISRSQITRPLGPSSLNYNDSAVAAQAGATSGEPSLGPVGTEENTALLSRRSKWTMIPTIPNDSHEDSSPQAVWSLRPLESEAQIARNALEGIPDYMSLQMMSTREQRSEQLRRPVSARLMSSNIKKIVNERKASDPEIKEGIEREKARRDAEARERAKRDQEQKERRKREQEEAEIEGFNEERRRGDFQITSPRLWVDEKERERVRLAEEAEARRHQEHKGGHLRRLGHEAKTRPRSLSMGDEPLPSPPTVDEVPSEGHDGNISPSEESSLTLEELVATHTPLDITGQIVIPDYRRQAHGGLAVVYPGVWRSRPVAVKVLKIKRNGRADVYWNVSNERRIKREINVWAALKHPNINEFLGYSTDFADFPAMVSPWCQQGTVSEYLERQTLSVKERLRLAQNVTQGLEYLHLLKVIHGDVKPANILVDDDGVAKLCDFGLVRLVDWEGPAGMTTTSPYTGTERYKAPELFITPENRRPVATFDGDIYSLGCIMLEFIERIYPFQRFTKTYELRDAIMDKCPPALRSETTHALLDMTKFFWNLLEACWDEPYDRPGIRAIAEALNGFAQTISTNPFL